MVMSAGSEAFCHVLLLRQAVCLSGTSENAVAETIPLVYMCFQRFLHYLKTALPLPIFSKNLILSQKMQAVWALPFMWMLSCPRKILHLAFSRHILQAFCCTSTPTFMNIWLWFSPKMVSTLDLLPKGDQCGCDFCENSACNFISFVVFSSCK